MPETTARLLEVWRAADRASAAARHTAEVAMIAAQAAEDAAVAARQAALDAGLTLDAADVATSTAHRAYAERLDSIQPSAGRESAPPDVRAGLAEIAGQLEPLRNLAPPTTSGALED